ncbi:hypothetical protein AVEN_143753-1 [Araneus ventricosus]|uniref:Uncharacterized protein n=1 Tax=Araneus ventricosus TaxID=182803 RepID=A0A4Y2AR56_ARAVE|nr:hypothetical protein AVEN_143753-1 [Araneus ventricosus]
MRAFRINLFIHTTWPHRCACAGMTSFRHVTTDFSMLTPHSEACVKKSTLLRLKLTELWSFKFHNFKPISTRVQQALRVQWRIFLEAAIEMVENHLKQRYSRLRNSVSFNLRREEEASFDESQASYRKISQVF